MLGAIRHKGYISWGNDADIGFIRKEYEKFRKACETELDHERYYMHNTNIGGLLGDTDTFLKNWSMYSELYKDEKMSALYGMYIRFWRQSLIPCGKTSFSK